MAPFINSSSLDDIPAFTIVMIQQSDASAPRRIAMDVFSSFPVSSAQL